MGLTGKHNNGEVRVLKGLFMFYLCAKHETICCTILRALKLSDPHHYHYIELADYQILHNKLGTY